MLIYNEAHLQVMLRTYTRHYNGDPEGATSAVRDPHEPSMSRLVAG
jgi:hypothetical protein